MTSEIRLRDGVRVLQDRCAGLDDAILSTDDELELLRHAIRVLAREETGPGDRAIVDAAEADRVIGRSSTLDRLDRAFHGRLASTSYPDSQLWWAGIRLTQRAVATIQRLHFSTPLGEVAGGGWDTETTLWLRWPDSGASLVSRVDR